MRRRKKRTVKQTDHLIHDEPEKIDGEGGARVYVSDRERER